MALRRPLVFDHEDRRRIYDHIERNGVVDRETIADDLGVDPAAVRHHVAILSRDGLVENDNGTLRIALAANSGETHVNSDGTTYTIRPARQEDIGGIVGVINQVVDAGGSVEAESVAELVDYEDVLLRWNGIESRIFFVAAVDEEVIGWSHIRGAELDKLDHTAELTVGVLAAYRGHGIGSALLRQALEWASRQGYERLYQSVPATNQSAITFLEQHGWHVEGVRNDHYRIDGDFVDEVMLGITLT